MEVHRKESDRGRFAESKFPNYDVIRESNAMYDSQHECPLAADEVFDIHCTCAVCLPNLILVCDASFVRPSI